MDEISHQDMLNRRQVLINGAIDDDSARTTIMKLLFLTSEDRNSPISLYINSPGGSVISTFAIADTIEGVSVPVRTYGLSEVHGTAIWILASGTAGGRFCRPDSNLAIVPATLNDPDSDSKSWDAQIELSKVNSALVERLLARTKLSEADAIHSIRNGRTFAVQDAIEAGIVDAQWDAEISSPS